VEETTQLLENLSSSLRPRARNAPAKPCAGGNLRDREIEPISLGRLRPCRGGHDPHAESRFAKAVGYLAHMVGGSLMSPDGDAEVGVYIKTPGRSPVPIQ
jgi:hypothetical protein